jgi:hypothetical protein
MGFRGDGDGRGAAAPLDGSAMTQLAVALDIVCLVLLAHTIVNATVLRRLPRVTGDLDERVSVLLPLRNEAARVSPAIRALLTQEHLADWELLCYDDDSSDGTFDVVRRLAGDRVAWVPTQPLPSGWLGKPHACAQLSAAATGSVLVFVDADVVLSSSAVASAVRLLRDARLDFVSPYPRQLATSWLERLVQPLLTWSWLTFLPLRVAERSSRRSLAAANGQLLVVDTAAYLRAGAHESVRAEVVEDIALARSLVGSGAHGTFVDGSGVATCRMYDGTRAVVRGYAKSLWCAFGSPGGGLLGAALMLLIAVVPWALLAATWWALPAALSGPAGRLVAALRTGSRPLVDALAQPLSVLAFAALLVTSVVGHRRGRLAWKGRSL